MVNRLAKVLSSLTKASNERLDQVISALEDNHCKKVYGYFVLATITIFTELNCNKCVECRYI